MAHAFDALLSNGAATNGSKSASNGATAKFRTLSPPVDTSLVSTLGMAAYRAPYLTQPHRMREAIQDAHNGRIPPMIGFFCGLTAPQVVRYVSVMGFDIIGLDWEHAATNVETMTSMVHDIQHFSEGRSHALVRIQGHDHAGIGNALDAGASIMVPQVETVEDAKHIVSAMKFGAAVNGTRSAPPARWVMGVSDKVVDSSLTLHQNLNYQASLTIQVESLNAIKNLDAILTECGENIDAVWLGSLDARISMGFPGFGAGEPEWDEAVKLFNDTMIKHNKPCAGFVFGPPEVRDTMAKGKSWICSSADMLALMGTMGELAAFRERYTATSQVGQLGK